MTYQGKRFTILGLSKTGITTARYLQQHGADCFLSESLAASPLNQVERDSLTQLGVQVEMGGHSQTCYTHADVVIASPGIPPSSTLIRELQLSGKQVISDVELAWQGTSATPWVGITGTNGKTTTTSLVSAILTADGKRAPACGNIGLPFFDVLQDGCPEVWVAELSSYQLERTRNFVATVGVFLNLTPDHLDWHGSLTAYQHAKFGFLTGDRSPGTLVYRVADPLAAVLCEQNRSPVRIGFSLDPQAVQALTHSVTLIEGKTLVLRTPDAVVPVLDVDQLQIIGPHNIENVMAAVAVTYALGVNPQVIAQACRAFGGVAHRLEYVCTLNGCKVYNDSKATNPEATLSALNSFADRQPVVLIAGGKDKNGPLAAFVERVKQQVSTVVLFGQAADRFAHALQTDGFKAIVRADTLETAVGKALTAADRQPVVFSPACASFDMFRNFEDRGDQFKAIIQRRLEVENDGLRSPSC
jgi:UDP-N-acetylmuramoylalanine--D-glutamate ligase